jgi:hypothetical protein
MLQISQSEPVKQTVNQPEYYPESQEKKELEICKEIIA